MDVKRWSSIRQRLVLAFAALTLLAGALQLWVAGAQIEHLSFDFFCRNLENDAYLMRDRLALETEDDDENFNFSRSQFAQLPHDLGYDYAIFNKRGRLEAVSLALYNDYSNSNSNTPEVQQAYQQGRGLDLRTGRDGQERLYVAVPFYHDERVSGVLVLSQPTAPFYSNLRNRWMSLALATLPVLSLALLVGAWFGARIAQPIKALHQQALQIAEGHLNVRVSLKGNDEISALGQAFNHMADHLDQLIQVQRAFISNAAHELRTPLMTMQLHLEALQSEQLSRQQQLAYMEEARQELRHMAQLVTSLLILARLDEGRHTPDYSPYDATALLHDLTREWRRQAKKAGIRWEVAWHELPDLSLPAQDLRMVMNNLLSNAIKYTPAGGHIRLSSWQDEDKVYLCVEDSGMGFSPQQAEQLFTRFYRTEQARSNGTEGSGLGLTIAQAIVQQAGGTITAYSPGISQGARFVVELSLKAQRRIPAHSCP